MSLPEQIRGVLRASTEPMLTGQIITALHSFGVDPERAKRSYAQLQQMHTRSIVAREKTPQGYRYTLVRDTKPRGRKGPAADKAEPAPAAAQSVQRSTPGAVLRTAVEIEADRIESAVFEHILSATTWQSALAIALELDEPQKQVALALRRLIDRKLATVRSAGDGSPREYSRYVEPEPAAAAASPQTVETAATEPAEPVRIGVPAEADGSLSAEIVGDGTGEALPEIATPAATVAQPAEPFIDNICAGCGCGDLSACRGGCEWIRLNPALGIGVCSRCVDRTADFDRQVNFGARSLAHQARELQLDAEDLIGQACDERADHAYIKSIACAAAALRRAVETLTKPTGAPAPSPTGATPS